MSHPVTVFRIKEEVGRIVDLLKAEIHNGFPVVDNYDPDNPGVSHVDQLGGSGSGGGECTTCVNCVRNVQHRQEQRISYTCVNCVRNVQHRQEQKISYVDLLLVLSLCARSRSNMCNAAK